MADDLAVLIRQLQGMVPIHGVGTPEGNVTAPPGKTYIDDAGGAGVTFWVKETGVGPTGWDSK